MTDYSAAGRREPTMSGKKDPHRSLSFKSTFCLQPLGDTTTRKGIFDVMLYGCIPVIFHPLSAPAMYTWHLSEEVWKDITIELPCNLANYQNDKGLLYDPVKYLQEYVNKNPEEVKRKQTLVRKYAFQIHYSMEHYQAGSSWPLDEHGKPVKDAYDITMDRVMGMHVGRYSRDHIGKIEDKWLDELPHLVALKHYFKEFQKAF